MNDNETGGMGLAGTRTRMLAEQAVTRMNSRLRWPIDDDARDGLVEAILKTGEPDKFLFRPEPFRATPPRWSLSGMIARAVFAVQHKWKRGGEQSDAREALSAAHYKVQRSGAVGLVITLLIALLVGVTDFGMPAEVGLQMARNKARAVSASGDIIVIAQDERSAQAFGKWPWPRRYDAQLVDRLHAMGAKTIVFDQTFAYQTNAIDDSALASAFDRAGGGVWLSARFVEEPTTGKRTSVVSLPLFRSRTRQAHFNMWFGMFGHAENIPFTSKIGSHEYPSSASVIANANGSRGNLRPDYAINYKTIPTISAIDIVDGTVTANAVFGKTVIIAPTASSMGDVYRVMGQGIAGRVYTVVIAAETIKAGIARELGYVLPLLVCAIIGIACILNKQRKRRALILISGTLALLILMFIGDRLRLHVEMVPALLALTVMGIRESTRSKIITAMTTNELTGLPNLSHLKFIKGYKDCFIVAIKIERYRHFIAQRPRDEQKILLRAIAARINVIAPNCVVHQGDDGLFVFLVPPDSGIDVEPMPGQLHALFTQDFIVHREHQRIGVSVGVNDELDTPFGERRAVAIDRAEMSEFVTLQAVQ